MADRTNGRGAGREGVRNGDGTARAGGGREWPSFLGPDRPAATSGRARFHVLPAPFERSVTYGPGTAGGPLAILRASRQVEVFDGIDVPARAGIETLPPIRCRARRAEDVLRDVEALVAESRSRGGLPVVLGGEHTVSLGAVRGVLRSEPQGVGIVQFDAHADLRERYQGDRLSHACVMRRIVELGMPCFQIGVRSLCEEEAAFRQQEGVRGLDAAVVAAGREPSPLLPVSFPESVYVTFDVDAFDPSVLPATGTPEPGGLFWYDALRLVEGAVTGRRVVGFDVVELAPVRGLHASDFTAAKLVYAIMGAINRLCVR